MPDTGGCDTAATTDRGTRPTWIVATEALSVATFVGLWSWVWGELFRAVPAATLVWLLPAALLAGWLGADFLSGCVHWVADRYFDPRTPVLGPLLIEPFRDHHRDPEGITRHGFLELLGNNALATLPLAGGLLAWGAPVAGVTGQALHAGVASLALALFATNAFHCWAHMARPPAPVRWLQRKALVLPPAVHRRHHAGGHDCSYCVTTGWLNPLLDRLRFFARVEGLLRRVGVVPSDEKLKRSLRAAAR